MRFFGSDDELSADGGSDETGPRAPIAETKGTKKEEDVDSGLLNTLIGGSGGGLFGLFGKLCGDSGSERAQLASDGAKAAGPAAEIQPLPYPDPKTPEEVAANEAVIKANQEAMASNKTRDDFIQRYIDSNATIPPDERTVAVGKAYSRILTDAKAKYGDAVGEMTMMELYAAHPDIVESSYAQFQREFPILGGVSFQQFMSTLPDSMKNVSLNTLDKILPKSMDGGTGLTPVKAGIGIGALIVLVLVIYLLTKKKGASDAS